jgi:ADP-ribose pyrophosphatase YjhB (NUDIX family)
MTLVIWSFQAEEEPPLLRHTRYQGAIIADDRILLIRHCERSSGRSYWTIPGGGREPGETEEECVVREMREETNLEVRVESLLLDLPEPAGSRPYRRRRTYVCRVVSGEAAPGYEPEDEAAARYAIVEVAWFDLRSEESWGELVTGDRITYPLLVAVRHALGYC